jgi:large subunit ribosomal protein L22
MEEPIKKLKKSVKIRLRKEAEANFKEENAGRLGEAVARLRNIQGSPRKMRLVVDTIRGEKVERALNLLKFQRKAAAEDVEKVLLSAIANWTEKNGSIKIEDADLYVKTIFVQEGRMLKRLRPAPQGRGYRVRKRSNHITVVIASLSELSKQVVAQA